MWIPEDNSFSNNNKKKFVFTLLLKKECQLQYILDGGRMSI